MRRRQYAINVSVIVADPLALQRLGATEREADAAIRAARRQVQRYGDEAREGLLSWCSTSDERALLLRALDPHTRVVTVVREWSARVHAIIGNMPSDQQFRTLTARVSPRL